MEQQIRYFVYQTPNQIRLVTTIDIGEGKLNAQMKGFLVEGGKLQTWENEDKMSLGFLDRLQGYSNISESQYQEHLATASNRLLQPVKAPQNETDNIRGWKMVEAQYSPKFLNEVREYLEDEFYSDFFVHNSDTIINGDLIIDYSALKKTAQTATRNIIVNGNLTITGNFDAGNDIETLPQFVYVTGDLRANNLILSGWLDMIVEGNVVVNHTVLAYYGEPGGRFQVNGNLNTKYLLSGWMYLVEVKGNTTGACYSFDPSTCISGFEAKQIKSYFKEEDDDLAISPLAATIFPYDDALKEYSFNFDLACGLLREGSTIFK